MTNFARDSAQLSSNSRARRLPVQRYIELAVKAGSYKSPSTRPNYLGLHDVPQTKPEEYLTPREREERIKMRRGILDYPSEVS